MLRARDAREISDTALEDSISKPLRRILKRIKKEARSGKYNVLIKWLFSFNFEEQLKVGRNLTSLGYYWKFYGPKTLYISWDKYGL